MRPVNRGARGAYPYDIDLSSWANLTGSLGNYTLNFTAAGVLAVTNNNTTVSLYILLNNIWLTVTKSDLWEIVPAANVPALKTAMTTIDGRIATEYRRAAPVLVTNVGRFCAYCEAPNPSPLPVEHMVPKDNYPLFALAWGNFMLTCTPCNVQGSGKGTNPQRAGIRNALAPPPANELDYYTRIRAWYLWPDTQPAYRDLAPRLEYWSTGQNSWQPVPAQQSVRPGITVVAHDYSQRLVQADIFLDGTNNVYRRYVRVVWVPTTVAAQNTVALIGLDRDGQGTGNNPTTSDGRMFDRTRAWFNIVGQLSTSSYLPLNNNVWQNWWANIPNQAAMTGYFSLWVRILQLMNLNDPTTWPNYQPLLTRFLNDVVVPVGFPGTDVTQVP